MKSFLAFVGVLAIAYMFITEVIMEDDPTLPAVPLTPEQIRLAENAAILAEYKKTYDAEMKLRKKTVWFVHSDATDVVYIGEGWVTYKWLGSCFLAKRVSWNSSDGITNAEVSNSVCNNAVELPELPPELSLTPTPTVGEVEY